MNYKIIKATLVFFFMFLSLGTWAQKKGIKQYYQTYTQKINADARKAGLPETEFMEGEMDEINGYLTFMYYGGTGQVRYEMALWHSDAGKDIIGVFVYTCSMENCVGEVSGITFYDAQFNEITNKLVPIDKIKTRYAKVLAQIQAKGASGDETFYAQIPKVGTTFKLWISLGKDLFNSAKPWLYPLAELKFDKVKGTFTYLEK